MGRDEELKNKSSSPHFDIQYNDQLNSVESLAEFHPEAVDQLSEQDRQILSVYFFLGREVDVEDVFLYRRELDKKNPALKDEAYSALRNFLDIVGVAKANQDNLLRD